MSTQDQELPGGELPPPVAAPAPAPAPADEAPLLDAPEPEPEPVKEQRPKLASETPNAEQHFPLNMSEQAEGTEILQLPSRLDSETEQLLRGLPNINIVDNDAARRWARVVQEGLNYNTNKEVFVSTLSQPDAEFKQTVVHNGVPLIAATPRYRDSENANVAGERGLIQLVQHLGHGTVFQAAMWHSGFWVTFKPPTEAELVELNRRIVSDKIMFGRQSYGLMYSNMTSYSADRLLQFAREHVYDLSVKSEDINRENVLDHLAAQDISVFLWAFICTMYPRGFQYERACVTDPDKCKHIVKETLNVSKLQWTNALALTDWQKVHMSSRQSKVKTLADITRYKEELLKTQKKRFTLNQDAKAEISFTLKTPSASQYIQAGQEWIGGIVEAIDAVIQMDASQAERERNITLRGQASAMRQYAHWVESIEWNGKLMDDHETKNAALNVITADDYISTRFIEEVVSYINSSTVSVIGIPVYDCPACKSTQYGHQELPHHTNVIPLDVMQVFFGLITQRLEKIANR